MVKYAFIDSPAMKYSPGSLMLTRADDGWLLEVHLDNAKSEEPVVATVVGGPYKQPPRAYIHKAPKVKI